MGGLKRYYAEIRTIATSEKWNLRIRVTPAYNRNELPYFEVITPVGLRVSGKISSAYFHFKDSQMEFFKSYYPQWMITDSDMEHIRDVMTKNSSESPQYTNWQMACYWWNIEHEILDFGTPMEQYFHGVFDKTYENNRSYIPHDQKMPETWIYDPPRKVKKRLLISD